VGQGFRRRSCLPRRAELALSSTEFPMVLRATQSNEDAGTAGGTGLTTGGDQGSALSGISRPCAAVSTMPARLRALSAPNRSPCSCER